MKILHTADWHIGNYNGPERNGVNLRSLDTAKCINTLLNAVKEEKPELVIIAGDLFDQARVWAERGLAEVQQAISYISKISETSKVVVMRGTPNHDGTPHFNMLTEQFHENENVHIVTHPQVVEVAGAEVACLPGFDRGEYRAKFPTLSKEEENVVFTEELGNIVLGLRAQCKNAGAVVLVSHYTVPGCNTESGQVQFLSQHEPVINPSVLGTADFTLVTLGHIHRPQQLENCKNTFYSGAINAMNFNDEGQDRGFWMHTVEGTELKDSKFHLTPIRDFRTIELDDEHVTALNNNILSTDPDSFWGRHPFRKGDILRVHFSCTDTNSKALDKVALEKALYQKGAFWVKEIVPDKVVTTVNRDVLDKADPITNLVQYLTEKAFAPERIDDTVEVATPIIQEVMAGTKLGRLAGVFEPVEISVKNYRNYAEETFNFKDISFCTINGSNGAGKSSLFMDAILDCLFEEPREGDLTGWIRADEKARSGSITFTFKIGETLHRVVRTRAKSGKATLNISECVDGEWENRSAEKIKDTQAEIISIIGMDSLTFRSCALIMQDQYGLFLQADKESRIRVLGNILGLGMYEEMQEKAKQQLSETNKIIAEFQAINAQIQSKVGGETQLLSDIGVRQRNMVTLQKILTKAQEEESARSLAMVKFEQEKATAELLAKEVATLQMNLTDMQAKKADTLKQKMENDFNLSRVCDIRDGVQKHKALLARATELSPIENQSKLLEEKMADLMADLGKAQEKKVSYATTIAKYYKQLQDLLEQLNRKDIEEAYEEWHYLKERQGQYAEKHPSYLSTKDEITQALNEITKSENQFNVEYTSRVEHLNQLQEKMELLKNVQCVDIGTATCQFLVAAKEAQAIYEPMLKECKEWKSKALAEIEALKDTARGLEKSLEALNYDPQEVAQMGERIRLLEPTAMLYQGLEAVKQQYNTVDEIYKKTAKEANSLAVEIVEMEKKISEIKDDLNQMSDKVMEYCMVKVNIEETKHWLDLQETLPLLEERNTVLAERLAEIETDCMNITTSYLGKTTQLQDIQKNIINSNVTDNDLIEAKEYTQKCQTSITQSEVEIGILQERVAVIRAEKQSLLDNTEAISTHSDLAATLEVLKHAFSQDGVPHNVIKSLLPQITETANTILGQMTGGKMGMEFRTEKTLKSNNKKEVVTLDIYIEEIGKPPLPYSSKSGGEKVKSALSAILALAEMKSSSAGIQLGMLFVDEPPFLDGDGTQAYCDALETIGNRYPDIKIMAITHDPAMKARFPQNLDVVKTEEGSKVILQ